MKRLIPDKANCTYWWIMYMDKNNPDNKPSVSEIHGYSKFQYQAEAKDKNNVLMAKIEMMWKNGYFKRAHYIEIFKKIAPLPSRQEDLLILTLYKNDYRIPQEILPSAPYIIKQYLKNFYDAIANGREIKHLRPLPSKINSKDDIFDVNRYRFTKHSELYEFAEKQISNGESAEMVNNFVRKYTEQKLINNPLITSVTKNFTKK